MSSALPAPDCPPPGMVPDHELISLIGRGSYGAVWLARNVIGQYRAVKIVCRSSFSNARPFERELEGLKRFEPVSRLHEGYIDVLHVGRDGAGNSFYQVMEVGDDEVRGQAIDPAQYVPKTLASEIAHRGRLPVEECIQLALSLTAALNHLHTHGLSHRDIKPSNIIFVGGQAKLADVGLVGELGSKQTLVGTTGYIPPEGPGTAQADLYALGKVLYEVSTGKDRLEYPELPLDFPEFSDKEQFLEFNEIVLHACHGEPGKRYASAQEMHAELVALLNGKSLKRLHLLERRWASLRRAAVVAAIVTGMGLVAISVAYWQWKQAWQNRQVQIGANTAYGNSELSEGRLVEALPFYLEAWRLDQEPQHEAAHRLRCGTIFARCPKLIQMWRQDALINSASFSPDGKNVLIAQQHRTAQAWDIATGQPASPAFAPVGGVESAAYSPDGQWVVTANQDQTVRVWAVATGQEMLRLPHPRFVFYARFSPDGQRIVTAGNDALARIWEAHTGQLLCTLKGHEAAVHWITYSPDARVIVTTSADGTARFWNAATGAREPTILRHPSWVYHAAFSPEGRYLVTSCFDGKARVWDLRQGQELVRSLPHGDSVHSAQYSPDGRFILTASLDSFVRLWDSTTLQPVKSNSELKHSARVLGAAFAPDGHRLVAACTDGTTWVWDLAANEMRPRPIPDCFSLDGRFAVSFTNNLMQVWEAGAARRVSPAVKLSSPVQGAWFAEGGDFLLVASSPSPERTDLQVLEVATGKALFLPLRLNHRLAGAVLSRQARRLATFAGPRVQFRNGRTGEPLAPAITVSQPVTSVGFSPDERSAFLTCDRTVEVRDATSGEELFPALPHELPVSYAAFSPDGRRLVTCTSDKSWGECWAQLWDATTGKPMGRPLHHRDGVLHAAFSPNGQYLATSSEDFTTIIWDAFHGRQLARPLRHDYQVNSATFSPDGRWLVTAGANRSIRLWDAATGEPLAPPLGEMWNIKLAVFTPALDHVLASATGAGHASVWDLPRLRWPRADRDRLSELFCGQPALPADFNTTDAVPLGARAYSAYHYLRAKYPTDFSTSEAEVIAWHGQSAALCEEENNWPAATFHLTQLVALEPGNLELARRLAEARQHVAVTPTTAQ